MTTRLRDRQDDERRETLGQMIALDAARMLIRSGCSNLDAVAALTTAADELATMADRRAANAVAEGESYAQVARALDMSRQAATKRYRHLRVVQ